MLLRLESVIARLSTLPKRRFNRPSRGILTGKAYTIKRPCSPLGLNKAMPECPLGRIWTSRFPGNNGRLNGIGRHLTVPPPTPPCVRVTYTAVRQIKSACLAYRRNAPTGASFLAAPTTVSSQPPGLRLVGSPDAVPSFLGKRLLLSFNPLSGYRSGLRFRALRLGLSVAPPFGMECLPSLACLKPTIPSADFSTVFSADYSTPSFVTLKHRGDLPG